MNQIVSTGDWIKIAILLVVALIAWYFVFTLYSQPFDLPYELQRERLIQEHQTATEPPVLSPTE